MPLGLATVSVPVHVTSTLTLRVLGAVGLQTLSLSWLVLRLRSSSRLLALQILSKRVTPLEEKVSSLELKLESLQVQMKKADNC